MPLGVTRWYPSLLSRSALLNPEVLFRASPSHVPQSRGSVIATVFGMVAAAPARSRRRRRTSLISRFRRRSNLDDLRAASEQRVALGRLIYWLGVTTIQTLDLVVDIASVATYYFDGASTDEYGLLGQHDGRAHAIVNVNGTVRRVGYSTAEALNSTNTTWEKLDLRMGATFDVCFVLQAAASLIVSGMALQSIVPLLKRSHDAVGGGGYGAEAKDARTGNNKDATFKLRERVAASKAAAADGAGKVSGAGAPDFYFGERVVCHLPPNTSHSQPSQKKRSHFT